MKDEKDNKLKQTKNFFSDKKVTLPSELVFDIGDTDFYSFEAIKKGDDILYHINPKKALSFQVWFRSVNRIVRAVIVSGIIPPIYFPDKVNIDRLPNYFNSICLTIRTLAKHILWKEIHEKIMNALTKEFANYDDPNVPDYISRRLNEQMLREESKLIKP